MHHGVTAPLAITLAAADEQDLPGEESWLGPGERATLAAMHVAPRRRSFLLGRLAARRALAALDPPLPVPAGSLEILAAPDGAPEVHAAGARLPVTLSISHSGSRGLCAVARHPVAVGVDLEEIAPRGPGLAEDFFTTEECAAVASAAPIDRTFATNLIWSAKESALKALRSGLRRDTREVQVALPPLDGTPLHRLAPRWRPLWVHTNEGRRFHGLWRRHGSHVITVVAEAELLPPAWPNPGG